MIQHHIRSVSAVRSITVLAAMAFVVAACGGDADPTATTSATATAEAAPLTAAPTVGPTATPAPTPEPTAAPTPEPTVEPAATSATATTTETAAVIPSPIGDPRPAPALAGLVNSDRTPFDLADYEGSNLLVYFGYTHCPDVCPETMGQIHRVFEEAPETQALFISVDPERDTPEFLEEWSTYLPERIHPVTGSPGAVRSAADNYGVKYARVETTSTAGYTMSHTAELYLIDEHGQLLLAYPFGTPAEEIAADIAVLEAG